MASGQAEVKMQVHHVRFFDHQPLTINCIAHDQISGRVAVSRSDASIEILNPKDNWMQEMIFPGDKESSIESLLWCNGRLFAGNIGGNVVEMDMEQQQVKDVVSSNAGPIWCLAKNSAEDRLAAGTEDGCVVLFDVSQEIQFLRGFGKQEGRILSIAWFDSEGDNLIITGGVNNIRQWSVKSGQPVSRMTLGQKVQKETIVWCIAVTKDFTIVSGDSRGVVTFWNGKESTQMKAFHCHKADVLSLCISADETRAFSGGVDSSLYQFTLCQADPSSERKYWIHQVLHGRHTHDIRALAFCNELLASGGVDTNLLVARLKDAKFVLPVTSLPKPGAIQIARDKNLILLQYKEYVEVWKLGTANKPFAEARGLLPLTQNRMKLLQLKARHNKEIQCCAISDGGQYLAFSDSKGVRLFQLNVEGEGSAPVVSVEAVKSPLPQPAALLAFSQDERKLVSVQRNGGIHVLDMATGVLRNAEQKQSKWPIHRLRTSPDNKYFATATLDHGVHLYDLNSCQHVYSCPVQRSQVSAMAFSPHTPTLMIAYCNHSLYEFDLEKKEYSQWSKESSDRIRTDWLKPLRIISNVAFFPDKPEKVVLHTDAALVVLDQTKDLSKVDLRPHRDSSKQTTESASRLCFKYKYLLYADFMSNGMLVAVERTPSAIEDNLPPSFKQKKFGVS